MKKNESTNISHDQDRQRIKPNIDNFDCCKQDFEELLDEYGEVLAPRIIEYEVERCEFPVEVLNEIRAIYAHIYRASVASSNEDVEGNIGKAKSHSKRAVLDCYKYLCVTYDRYYHEFFKKFGYINWTKTHLMDAVHAIDKKRVLAVEALKEAKIQESTEATSEVSSIAPNQDYRVLYKKAYDEYVELVMMIRDLETAILEKRSIVSRFPAFWVAAIGALGLIAGFIVGFLL